MTTACDRAFNLKYPPSVRFVSFQEFIVPVLTLALVTSWYSMVRCYKTRPYRHSSFLGSLVIDLGERAFRRLGTYIRSWQGLGYAVVEV
ncbi:hypothetical protein BDV30DRAFT_218417 [Aspergillus minisclerotigenes]|uniref:Uncharacterized protein n=1 Tax=Aspergillus minisclerotigenes TaxID=656917 RepID=A0A5N6IT58_9EURO|nr:hypothetical protein BDV30DRAFT_218417 [Aspergillus minisclerotigenes]